MVRLFSPHRTHIFTLFLFLFSLFFVPIQVQAQENQNHYTVVINQVRGTECCGAGGLNELREQIATVQQNNLSATFTVRYDTLNNPDFSSVLRQAESQSIEIGGFLEITPQLASDSGVIYNGSDDNWYEAQNVYLIGYAPEDRLKLIDTYMAQFYSIFGHYPQTTTAWIIDTPSLEYLHTEYGVEVHQITREQWGTDSYTMWGGPPHVPYYPSENWAFMPSASRSANMPVMVRQTISDPVWNYGDTTNSYTSQPNDYGIKERGFDYFVHLFNQAHKQTAQPFTFALLGLENSMPAKDQQEFIHQLEYVAKWQSPNKQAITASDFAQRMRAESPEKTPVTIHHGSDYETGHENQAWWITTPKYRLRLRYNNQTLYISDIRVYDSKAVDPYTTRVAEKLAYWVTPFLLDGGRFWQSDTAKSFHMPHSDQLTPRKTDLSLPSRIVVANDISADQITFQAEGETQQVLLQNQPLFSFHPEYWETHQAFKTINNPLQELLTGWQWTNLTGTFIWGFATTQPNNNLDTTSWHAFIHPAGLEQEREERYPYLYPEVRERELDLNKTSTLVTNAFAQAGRNPIRLAFFPRDSYGYPTYISEEPQITIDSESVHTEITQPSSQNGLVFIDLTSGEIQQTTVTLNYQNYQSTHTITFAPNCKQQWKTCLQNPHYWWWYFRNWSGDKYRQWQEKNS